MIRSSRAVSIAAISLLAALFLPLPGSDAGQAVRKAVQAGKLYPDTARELRAMVDGYLAKGAAKGATEGHPIALIAPHGGYGFSGETAGCAFAAVKGREYRRVVVLGARHTGKPFRGASVLDVRAYATPLGEVAVDSVACLHLLKHPLFSTRASAHRSEHSIEVQLPFLQRSIGSFSLVPVIVGYLKESDYVPVAAAIRQVVDDNTLVVVSSDLTHYGSTFGFAPFREKVRENLEKLDRGAVDFITRFDAPGFRTYCRRTGATICGRYAIGAVLHMLPAETQAKAVDYCRSGDRGGDYTRSVSYAAVVFAAPGRWGGTPRPIARVKHDTVAPGQVSIEGQKALLALARQTLAAAAEARHIPAPKVGSEELRTLRGVFVTLNKYGQLRGCVGNFAPKTPLYQTITELTQRAAFDRRFTPVAPDEVDDIEIDLSVLSPPKVLKDPLAWELGKHGITVRRGVREATYLPQVAEHFKTKEEMLAACCRKAGIDADSWRRKGTTVEIYEAQVFGEATFDEPSPDLIVSGKTYIPSGPVPAKPTATPTVKAAVDKASTAVAIGIGEYAFLGKIPACRDDARRIAELLTKARRLDPERVAVVTDDATAIALRATKGIILERIRLCAEEARPEGMAFVYFSGHAARKGDELVLVPADCRWEGGIPLSEIVAILQKSRAGQKVLVIDAAHAGASRKGGGLDPSLAPATADVAIFLSCGRGELSQPTADGKHSIYTSAFIATFRLLTDVGDGFTARSLQQRLERRVREARATPGESQTPALRLARDAAVVLAPPTR